MLSHALARRFRVSCSLPHNFGPKGARKKREAPLGSSHPSADAGMGSRPISRSAFFAYFASCSVLSGGNALESSPEGAEMFPAQQAFRAIFLSSKKQSFGMKWAFKIRVLLSSQVVGEI